MKKYYCPICGYTLSHCYTLGVICSCCGNEYGYDDVGFVKATVNKDTYKSYILQASNLAINNLPIPNEIKTFLDSAHFSENEVFSILRQEWIKKNCKFKLTEDKPKNWCIEKAREQLLNIGINLDDAIKIRYEYYR